MKNIIYIALIAILTGGFCVSCAESDDFSNDAALKLSFSSDTIRFDTVFATVGSSVTPFKIYNRNNKSLSIESIEIVNPDKSGFTMNIDGEMGTSIRNLDVLKKDSLYGFLRVKVDPLREDNPVLIRDSIRFKVNGNVQYIILEAVGRNVHVLRNVEFIKDTTIRSDKPYLIFDSLKVDKGVNLTIEAGTELFFHDKASMNIWGSIEARGNYDKKIVFRGDRFDQMNGVIPYDNVPGQWKGITFYSESYGSILNNVVIKNAETGLYFYPSALTKRKVVLENTIVSNSSVSCIIANNCYIDAINCLFANSRQAVLNIRGGRYSFVHCTIANYYQWSNREVEAVTLANHIDGNDYPLLQCDFVNSIIYGSRLNEIDIANKDNTVHNFTFRNCVIRNKKEFSDSQFVNVIWNKDPNFCDLNNSGLYSYNFNLTETSSAIGTADFEYSKNVPFDLAGNSRIVDNVSDVGCYEWIADVKN